MSDPRKSSCRHFNGIQHEQCEAGLRYKDIVLETNEQMRRGWCSAACQRHHAKPPVFTGSRKPNTSLTILAPRPAINRKPGTDRKTVSE